MINSGHKPLLSRRKEKNELFSSLFKPLPLGGGNNFEFLIDNFELSRSDLTGLVRSLGDRVSDRLIPLEGIA